ncbi:Uncharacterized protein OBRU01_08413, partial [Operophtera brumata]
MDGALGWRDPRMSADRIVNTGVARVVSWVIRGTGLSISSGLRHRIYNSTESRVAGLLDESRQIATDVHMYRSYRTVSVVFYPLMRDVTDAHFTFQSEELHLNAIGRFWHNFFALHAVNPDGYEFPKNFIDRSLRESIHTLEILSDGSNQSYTIRNPKPGNWYALVYIKWEDPRTQKVEQQGLVAVCQTILYTDLQVRKANEIEVIDCYRGVTVDYTEIPAYFKCITIDSVERISFNLTIVNASTIQNEVSFKVQALSLPTEENYLINCAFDPRINTVQTIVFAPHPNAWHYIHLDHVKGNASAIADCESYYPKAVEQEIDNHTVLDFMRDDKGRFFTFDYGLPTTDLQDVTSLINITSGETKSLRFKVNQFLDTGGSIAIEASLLMSIKYFMGYKRQYKSGSLLAFTEDNQFFKAVICMDIGHASLPLANGRCRYNDKEKPALFVLNSTDSESIYDKVVIPFPESGTWYLSLRLFCDSVVCPCRTSDDGWDCSDDSRMDSRAYMLVSVLLLTVSNLLFIFSTYVAIVRRYYTEAMMYVFTMVFSTFYHACDAPSQVAYCIMRGNILQFGDFYCGIMCFWVTLLAMSILDDKFRSSLQLVGAIIIALLTTWNMHSFVSFLLPVAVGIVVLLASWVLDYRANRRMKYPRSYYTRHLPLGLLLVSVGLICYAFLQTEQNYKIVHSIWHMIIAVSVVFLLPDAKRGSDSK